MKIIWMEGKQTSTIWRRLARALWLVEVNHQDSLTRLVEVGTRKSVKFLFTPPVDDQSLYSGGWGGEFQSDCPGAWKNLIQASDFTLHLNQLQQVLEEEQRLSKTVPVLYV